MNRYEWKADGMYLCAGGDWVRHADTEKAPNRDRRDYDAGDLRDRVEILRQQAAQAQRALALAHAMLDTVKAERDALQRQLAMADALINDMRKKK